MSTEKRKDAPPSSWPTIRSASELDARSPHVPAYLLIPPALVRPVWEWLNRLDAPSDAGEWSRALEMLLVCLSESDGRGIAAAMNDLKGVLRRMYRIDLRFEYRGGRGGVGLETARPPVVPMPEGEEGAGLNAVPSRMPPSVQATFVSAHAYPARCLEPPWRP